MALTHIAQHHVGQPVEWEKAGRAAGRIQTGILVGFIEEGTTGQEVYDSIRDRVVAANRYLSRMGKPALPVDVSELTISRRHMAFAMETHETNRVLVMADDPTGGRHRRRWFCPNVYSPILA